MELDLKSQKPSRIDHQAGKLFQVNFSEAGGDQNGYTVREVVPVDDFEAPFKIVLIADDEFDLISRFESVEIGPVVGLDFTGAWGFDVQNDPDSGVDLAGIHGTAGFQ